MHRHQRQALGTAVLLMVGLGSGANALWMLAAPQSWFGHVPAAVPDFGPYNGHFVRDLGVGYLAASVAMLWGASSEAVRWPTTLLAALFFGGHALVHVLDTASGHVGPHHWLLDLPTTYLPVVLLAGVIWVIRGVTR